MIRDMRRAVRYGRSWLSDHADVESREITVDRGDRSVPATLVLPRVRRGPLPAWIVLHGVTRPGRAHPQLQRFVRALAHSRTAVLVPEVPEWRELDLGPGRTPPTVLGCLDALTRIPEAAASPPGLLGFSFGAPQAVALSGRDDVGPRLAGVAGFGGYCDLERTVRFQFTGEHEWEGRRWHVRPDPYGRWIVAGNFLSRTPSHGDAEDVADALLSLAREAGDRRVPSEDASFDPVKERLREALGASRRELFDLIAPPSDRDPDPAEAEPLVRALTRTARREEPDLDPGARLADVRVPVELIHGRGDRLIPFSESLRLRERLPDGVAGRVTVTRLFAHSKGEGVASLPGRLWEGAVFVGALRRVLGTV